MNVQVGQTNRGYNRMTVWYYVSNREQVGPVDEIAMRSLIRTGAVFPKTSVWKDGMEGWLPAAETELKQQFSESESAIISTDDVLSEMPGLPGFTSKSLHDLWLWFACIIGSSLPLYLLALQFLSKNQILVIVGMVALTAGIIGYVLLYRFWSLIQDGRVRTSPGKAVGYCFIPLYNIYWNYVAYVGLAADINAYCRERKIAAPIVNEGLALMWYILSIFAIIPGVGGMVSIPLIIFQIMMIKQFVDVSQAIIASRKVVACDNLKQD